MPEDHKAVHPHTPSTLYTAFVDWFCLPESSRVLDIEGVYGRGGDKLWGKYYYDRLQDEATGTQMTVQVPRGLRPRLEPGRSYLLRGAPVTKEWSGAIEPQLRVTEILGRQERQFSDQELARFELLQRLASRAKKDVDGLLRRKLFDDKTPTLTVIFGESAIVDDDLKAALGEAKSSYWLTLQRINLSNPAAIDNALLTAEGDAVAIIRGGGSGLEVFDDPELVKTVLALKLPLITAIGHAQDSPLLEQAADRSFPTPTALGSYLRRLADEVAEDKAGSKAKLVADVEKVYKPQLEMLKQQLTESKKAKERLERRVRRQNAGWLMALLLVVAIALLIRL